MNGAQYRAGAQPCPESTAAWAVLDDLLGPAPTVEPRTMFGLSCFAVAGRPFACVYNDAIALKLPDSEIARLQDHAIGPFQPNDRPLTGWVLIRRDANDGYTRDDALIELAMIASSEAAAGVPRP